MTGFFDSQSLEFTCPHCNRRVKDGVAKMKRPDYKCPHCGSRFDTIDFQCGIDAANREVEEFKRRVGKIEINIKL